MKLVTERVNLMLVGLMRSRSCSFLVLGMGRYFERQYTVEAAL